MAVWWSGEGGRFLMSEVPLHLLPRSIALSLSRSLALSPSLHRCLALSWRRSPLQGYLPHNLHPQI